MTHTAVLSNNRWVLCVVEVLFGDVSRSFSRSTMNTEKYLLRYMHAHLLKEKTKAVIQKENTRAARKRK